MLYYAAKTITIHEKVCNETNIYKHVTVWGKPSRKPLSGVGMAVVIVSTIKKKLFKYAHVFVGFCFTVVSAVKLQQFTPKHIRRFIVTHTY